MPKKHNKKREKRQLHDEFFRKQLSDKKQAQDLFRQFLPSQIVQKLDLSRMELDGTAYITAELAEFYSDLVWLCPYADGQLQIALLLEHKSSPVPYPHFQLLHYMLAIWEKNLKEKKPLSPIIPIIFYHGKEKWQQRSLFDYFGPSLDEALKPYIPNFNYELINLNKYSKEEILAFKMGFLSRVLLALWLNQDKKSLKENFTLIFTIPNETRSAEEIENIFYEILVYLMKSSEFSSTEIKILLTQVSPQNKNKIMSTYEAILQEGREEGIKKGREEGIEKGIKKGREEGREEGIEKEKIEVISNARLEGLSIEIISKLVKMTGAEVRQILDELGME